MPYRFVLERQDYSDYASGRVFYGRPGQPAFPVRLASEILQRCLAVRQSDGAAGRCVLYDPCCGGAYHLGALAYLHWRAIDEIVGSDVDEEALSLAGRNLALLTVDGLERRIVEISAMLVAYGKVSHAAALDSAQQLRQRLSKLVSEHPISTRLFRADATDGQALVAKLGDQKVDVVITDVPYGQRSRWRAPDAARSPCANPLWHVLEALRPVLSTDAVVAIAADKRPKIAHGRYQRIERFQIGKRQIVLCKLLRSRAARG